MSQGHRNDHLTSIAGRLQNTGVAPDALLAALPAHNASEYVPPLDEEKAKAIAANIARYAPKFAETDVGEQIAQLALAEHFDADDRFWSFDGRKWSKLPQRWLDGLILRTTRSTSQQMHKGRTTSALVSQVRMLQAETAVNDDRLRFLTEPLSVIDCRDGELLI